MLYVVYNEQTDYDLLVTEEENVALKKCKDLLKHGNTSGIAILEYGCSEQDYYNTGSEQHFQRSSSVPEFFNNHTEMILEAKAQKEEHSFSAVTDQSGVEKMEMYHNLTPEEQKEVLEYTSDDLLLKELLRRLTEYRTAITKVNDTMDLMQIFV